MRESKPRWYHPTPGRFLIGVLLVEVLLLLSERFSWFPFNEKKGWTVLIAMATVCGAVLFLLLWLGVSLLLRWRFQFSLRTLLLFLMMAAILCSWFSVKMQAAKRQREVVEWIQKVGADVSYDYEYKLGKDVKPARPPATAWLRDLLGVDFFSEVTSVEYYHLVAWVTKFVKFDKKADGSQSFTVDPPPSITDPDLQRLGQLGDLERLSLAGSRQVTDAGLKHLEGLTNLEYLNLSDTQISDAGLKHLKRMKTVKSLDVSNTRVTSERLTDLQEALPNCVIWYDMPSELQIGPYSYGPVPWPGKEKVD